MNRGDFLLENFISSLPGDLWVDELINRKHGKKIPAFSLRDKEQIRKNLEKSFDKVSRIKLNAVISWLSLSILTDQSATFNQIRRKGWFRCSHYITSNNVVPHIIETILKVADELNITEENQLYLKNIYSFQSYYGVFKGLQDSIRNKIILRDKVTLNINGEIRTPSLIKELLVYIDYFFLTDHYPQEFLTVTERIECFDKEAIAEGVSFLIYMYESVIKIDRRVHALIDEEFILSDDFEQLVVQACQYKKLQEIEILIDSFLYNCICNEGNITIKAPHPEIEKSIRIGYVRTGFQAIYSVQANYIENAVSFERLAEIFYTNFGDDLCKLVGESRLKRYVLEVPEILYQKIFENEGILQEEYLYLAQILKEQFIDIETLKRIEIKDGLSLYEFLKIKRIFIFMQNIYSEKILQKAGSDSSLLFRSLIPTFSKTQLIDLISGLRGITKPKANAFLDLVSWNPKSQIIFDIQYQSLLKLRDFYFLPLSVFKMSDAIRNLYASEHKQSNPNLLSDGQKDPLTEILSNVFSKQGFLVKTNINYTYQKNKGEIDFLAFKDDWLIIAECKNSILPASVYELRTTYDYVLKAKIQLDLIMVALENEKFCDEFYNNYNITNKAYHTLSCVVMGNRLFCGCNQFGHPIRYIHEFANIIESGTLKTEKGSFCMWEKDQFSINDLITYFDDENSIIRMFFDSTVPQVITYKIGERVLSMETYTIDQLKVKEKFEAISWPDGKNAESKCRIKSVKSGISG